MTVDKHQRAIVVINELDKHSGSQAWLYRWLEGAGRTTAATILSDDYGEYVALYDSSATKNRLVNALYDLTSTSGILEVDLIVMLHGAPHCLYFYDGGCEMGDLAAEIDAKTHKNKLRMVYSTACYGASHIVDFRHAGFNAAVGAVGVNTNGATEFPVLLQMWAMGAKLRDALSTAENPLTRIPADEAARIYASSHGYDWADEVNSDKILSGSGSMKITTNYRRT